MLDRLFLIWREVRLESIGDRLGDFALNREHIGQVAIVSLGPQVRIGPGVDQLRVHAHLFGGALHAAFQDVRDSEPFADFAKVPPGRIGIASRWCG